MAELRFDPPFRSEGRGSRYPFADSATLTADTGLVIDRDLFVDAALWLPGMVPPAGLLRIEVDADKVTLVFGSSGDEATTGFDPAIADSITNLALVDNLNFRVGTLVVDPSRLALSAGWPRGIHVFKGRTGELAASCLIPGPARGLRGLVVGDRILAGDVWIAGDRGVVFEADGTSAIRVHVVGDPNARRRDDATRRDPRLVAGIRVIDDYGADFVATPSAGGRFAILVGTSVYPNTTLRIGSRDGEVTIGLAGRPI